MEVRTIADERSAAFIALGIAQQLKEPVVLVCTSGSAALNYFPAIAEAFFSANPPTRAHRRPASGMGGPMGWANDLSRGSIW